MITRRELVGGAAALGALAARGVVPVADVGIATRAIPKTGERIPVVGVGTNNYSPATPEERAARRAVIARLTERGASVIDTAPAYRQSETTIGELLAEVGNRNKVFLATKITAQSGTAAEGVGMFENSLRALRTDFVELLQVHNLTGAQVVLPLIRDWVAARRIRYVGITTSRAEQYPQVLELMRTEKLDFVQVDYSIANRGAAAEILPLARKLGIAVLINLPFGGRRDGNLFPRTRSVALPTWAGEFGAATWAHFFLKYVLSHPAVTCVIPGTTKVENLDDNLGAARGPMPTAKQRARMERWWDSLAPAS